MPLSLMTDGGLRTVSALKVNVDGSLRPIASLKVMADGELQTVFSASGEGGGGGGPSSPVSLAISPGVLSRTVYASTGRTVSAAATAIPSGGTLPYSYVWTQTDGDAVTVAPSGANVAISAFLFLASRSGSLSCTVTDALGATATAVASFYLAHEPEGGAN